MTTIILQAGWAISLMGRAARRAAMGRLLHVLGRATQRAGATAQARPVGLCRATAHGSSGCAVLGPGQISCAACWPIWPGP
jgi:hypothetical protein